METTIHRGHDGQIINLTGDDAPQPRRLPTPLRPGKINATDVALFLFSALSSLCLVWVLFFQVTSLSGALGFLVCWYALFLVVLWVSTTTAIESQVATDRIIGTLVVSAAALVIALILYIIIWVMAKAIPTIHWGVLFTKDQKYFQPADPNALNTVGIKQAIIGTVEQVLVAAVIGIPIAVATAVFLNEVGGKGVKLVRTVVTAMSGTPSVVAGIFVFSMLILHHIIHYSGFAASLALLVIFLPSVTRVTEEVLRVVPSGLREASDALGAPAWRTTWSVVLPTARSGVVTGVLLGVARIVGETAPLLFTCFGSQVTNWNVFSKPQSALPLIIFSDVQQAQPVLIDLAFQAAAVLITMVLVLFVLARVFSRVKGKDTKKRAGRPTEDDSFARMVLPVPISRPEGEEDYLKRGDQSWP